MKSMRGGLLALVAAAGLMWGCPTSDPPAENSGTGEDNNDPGCSSTCFVGEFQCLNETTLLECVQLENGCYDFGDAKTCGAGTMCRAGQCRQDTGGGECEDLCNEADGPRCTLQGKSERCVDSDGDGCFEYATSEDCRADGKECNRDTGLCEAVQCDNVCDLQNTRCEDELISECVEDANGCLVYAPAKDCPDGETCMEGSCVAQVSCESECDPAEPPLCGPTGIPRACTENAEGCFEYTDQAACADGTECRKGVCEQAQTCEDLCAADGATACDGDRIKSCRDTNGDGCLEFDIAMDCPNAGDFCDSSGGAAACTAPPQTGAVVINEVFYDALGDDLRDANGPNESSPVFIELFGPPNLAIGGYEVDLVNGTNGMSYQRVPLPMDAKLSGDGYALILMEQADFFLSLSTANEYLILKKPSAGATQDAMQNGSDSVVLYNDQGMQVDALGYGSFGGSNVFTGEGSPAEDVIPGRSLGRRPGASDTDDNSADFVSYYPTPGLPNSDLVITEIYVDQPGADGVSGQVETFIELSAPIQGWEELTLDGYVVRGINGNNGMDYISLQGFPTPGIPITWLDDPADPTNNLALGSNGRIVVCHIDSPSNYNSICDTYYDGVDWQNGPDSVVLEYNGRVVDAIAYGDFSGGATAAGEGTPAPFSAQDSGKSLNRWPYQDPSKEVDTGDNATDFHLASPTPGADNAFPAAP